MAAPVVHLVDDSALIASERNLIVGAWWHAAKGAHVEAFRECARRILAEHDKFLSALLIMDGEGVFTFSDEVRRGATELVRETEAQGAGTALVVLRPGFVGAAIRAFLSGVFLVARSKEPQKAFVDTHAAANWLAGCLRASDPATNLTAEDLDATLTRTLELARERADGRNAL